VCVCVCSGLYVKCMYFILLFCYVYVCQASQITGKPVLLFLLLLLLLLINYYHFIYTVYIFYLISFYYFI